jgi:hypothetical protein
MILHRVRKLNNKLLMDGRHIIVRRLDKQARKIERLYKFRGYKKL